MKDINDIIDRVVKTSGRDEKIVEKLARSLFADIQEFTNEKKGVCIQLPYVGTFKFRISAIPNYVNREKGYLTYWIQRLFIGQHKHLIKTITIATDNIQLKFYHLRRTSLIKEEYVNKHAKYRKTLKDFLEKDIDSDPARMDEYIHTLSSQIMVPESSPFPSENL